MLINDYLIHDGGVINEIDKNDRRLSLLSSDDILCLSIMYSYSPPKLKPWNEYNVKRGNGLSTVYGVGQVICGEFEVFCEERGDFVRVDENTVIRVGDKYVYFTPARSSCYKGWKEVSGEFDLNFSLLKTKIRVKC